MSAYRRATVGVVVYGAIPGFVVLNWLAFRWLLGTGYVDWYLTQGPLVVGAAALVGQVFSEIEDEGLISRNPGIYLAAHLQIVGIYYLWLAAAFRAWPEQVPGRTGRGRSTGRPMQPLLALGDRLYYLTLPVMVVVVAAALLGWILVVAPLNYFVVLVSGTPTRLLRGIDSFPVDRSTRTAGTQTGFDVDPERGEVNVEASGFHQKPFAATQAVTAALLFAVGTLV